MRLFGYRIAAVLSLYIVVAFSFAGPLHSVIQHNDTDALAEAVSACEAMYGYGHCKDHTGSVPDSHPSARWAYIHSVLGNEGKYGIGVLPGGHSLAGMYLAEVEAEHVFTSTPRSYPDTAERQLSRGIFAYRRFG